MKKVMGVVLAVLICLGAVGCGGHTLDLTDDQRMLGGQAVLAVDEYLTAKRTYDDALNTVESVESLLEDEEQTSGVSMLSHRIFMLRLDLSGYDLSVNTKQDLKDSLEELRQCLK